MLTVNSPPTCPITISTAPPHYPLSLHSRASPLHHLPAHNILTHPSSAADSPSPPSPTASDSFETQIEKLKKKLKHAENELDEAQRIAATQDEHVRSLEGDHEERKKEFEAREASLQQDKKDLEEHMVSVVVQQVREAKAKERNTVRDECEAEFNEKMADVNKEAEELRAKVADLEKQVASYKDEVEKLKGMLDSHQSAGAESVDRSEVEAKEADLASAKSQLEELTAEKSKTEKDLAEALATIDELKAQTVAKDELDTLAADRDAHKTKVEELAAEVAVLKTQLSDLEELKAKHTELEASHSKLSDELAARGTQDADADKASKEEAEGLRNTIAELQASLKEAKDTLDQKASELDAKTKEHAEATEQVTSPNASTAHWEKPCMTFARAGARQECPCLRVGQGVVPQWLPRV